MEDQLKAEIVQILENAVRTELGKPRVIRAWDGRVKSVSGKHGPFSYNMIASGELYDSVYGYFEGDLEQGDFSINLSFSPNSYWYYLQNGRQPGQEIIKSRQTASGKSIQYKSFTKFPPLDAIKGWLREKPVTQYRNRLGQFITRDTQAYLIGRAIARDGQAPYDFIGNALVAAKDPLLEKLREYSVSVFGGQFPEDLELNIQL
jgi:hypothetical protein